MFSLIDMESWPRRDHFHYYRTELPCSYCLTIRLDVTRFLSMLKKRSLRFYPSFIYCVSRLIEEIKEFRMGVTSDGNPGFYDVMHPVYTVFHEDDHTFSDLWSTYDRDFPTFYRGLLKDLETYGSVHHVKARPEAPPPNFYCISAVPWLDYSGYSSTVSGIKTPNLFPVITFGKYTEENGVWSMPFTLNISHAAADSYHSSQFLSGLQAMLDSISLPAP